MDAPLLDPRTVFRQGARAVGLPLADQTADLALFIARLRAGISWAALDQRSYAAEVELPVLIMTGVNDSTVPVTLIDDFAARLPAAEYHRVEGAEHVEAWNENPAQYEAWLTAFFSSARAALAANFYPLSLT